MTVLPRNKRRDKHAFAHLPWWARVRIAWRYLVRNIQP